MEDSKEYFKEILFKAITHPGDILYFPYGDGLGFMTATDDKSNFDMVKIYFEKIDINDKHNPLKLYVYIENDNLFFYIGDYMLFNFTFGLNNINLIKDSLYVQNTFDFLLVNVDEEINITKKTFTFTDRHKEVIKSYILNTYDKEVNLHDKFGELSPYKTEREAQLAFLQDAFNFKLTKNNENLIEYISKKYDIHNIDKTDIKLMNEILDYVLTRFSINSVALGYCVHDKMNQGACKKEDCIDCNGCQP